MPRVGLNAAEVVAAGARLADEEGLQALTIAALAQRLGVKAPALYKHVDGIDDLRRRIATLAMVELADDLRGALQGKAGVSALRALFASLHAYVTSHPGRYAATTGQAFGEQGDELLVAATRVMESIRAVLSGYGLAPDELDHAIRMLRCTLHGYALLDAEGGFQWGIDPAVTMNWMIGFMDRGFEAAGG